MGKTYVDTVKYVVYSSVEIGGLVEKPDVVGAIFGQTEGLLGDELDLRELQKNGRIGRIEVELQGKGGRSIGKIILPSSLDMVETSILAAALETVDRVGPCEAKIVVEKMEDTRNMKRKMIVERAKNILKNLLRAELPESKEISELVRQEVKIADVSEYGPEKLPSGPNLEKYESLIIVEGRADVINLMKNDLNNVVAVGGANVPTTLADLCRKKEIIVFLDGDRGGDIILKQLSEVCELDFVARAPRGREVEELTRKELIKCLRSKIPVEQVAGGAERRGEGGADRREEGGDYDDRRRPPRRMMEQESPAQFTSPPPPQAQPVAPVPQVVPEEFHKSLNELENTLRARIYDKSMGLSSEIPVRDLIKTLSDAKEAHVVVLDGIVTQRLVDLADSKGVKILLGVKIGNIFKRPEGMMISTKT